ncbi:hypothetical protein BDZ45DRAFT_349315 [Acephala macrosclerotiorum]|nr:hypothetical protein BDZ45DRAFT_349315 [Acephala macrosclerotiorum]
MHKHVILALLARTLPVSDLANSNLFLQYQNTTISTATQQLNSRLRAQKAASSIQILNRTATRSSSTTQKLTPFLYRLQEIRSHGFTGTMAESLANVLIPPPPSFTCFSLLPYDIRACIWRFAALQPRNLDIWPIWPIWPIKLGRFNYIKNIMGEPMHSNPVWRYVTTRPPPAILHASQESRAIGLQYYHPRPESSSSYDERHELKINLPARIYFNLCSDCICLMVALGPVGEEAFPADWSTHRVWDRFEAQVFNLPRTTVALNIRTCFRSGVYTDEEFLSRLDKQKEVLLYYCDNGIVDGVLRSQPSASVEFVELDESVIEGPGICTNLKNMHPAFLDEQRQKRATVSENRDSRTNPKVWTGPLAVKWVTLVINGVKVGLQ